MSKHHYILLLFFLIACDSSQDIKYLSPAESVKEFKNNIFLTENWNIQNYNNSFFLNDFETNQILVLDSLLELKFSFGKKGNGPGEFRGAGSFVVYEDSVYVYDAGGMRINVFTQTGEFERTIPLPPTNLDWSRFAIRNHKMYLTAPVRSDADFLIMDFNGEILKEVKSPDRLISLNHRILLSLDEYIVSINRAAPLLKLYTEDGELIYVFDFREIEGLNDLWKHYENNVNQHEANRNTTMLFKDANSEGAFMYVLCAGWPGRDNYAYIVKLLLNNDRIEFKDLFKIEGSELSMSLFQSIALRKNNLYAVESLTGYISTFDLSDSE